MGWAGIWSGQHSGSIKPEGSSDGRHNLTYQSIRGHVDWALSIKVSTTDVIDGLLVNHEGTIRVLQGGVGGEDGAGGSTTAVET